MFPTSIWVIGVLVEVKLGWGADVQESERHPPPTGFSGSFVLISHSPLGSGRLGPLPGKDAFHGCCMYQISPPKPTGDRGDREQTNISEKANKPETPRQRLSQFSAETWIKQVTWPTTFPSILRRLLPWKSFSAALQF